MRPPASMVSLRKDVTGHAAVGVYNGTRLRGRAFRSALTVRTVSFTLQRPTAVIYREVVCGGSARAHTHTLLT